MNGVSIRQFRAFDVLVFTFCSTITLGIVFLPFVSGGEIRNICMQLITAALPYFLLLWLIYLFCKSYTDHDFFKALRTHVWSGIYWMIMLYFISSILISGISFNKSLDIIVSTYLLQNTPNWLIILTFLIVVGFAVNYGILGITRFIVLLAFLEVFILIIICSLIFSKNFNWVYIPPLWDFTIMEYLKTSVSNMTRYSGILPLLAFIVYVKKDEPLWKPMSIGLAFVALFYVAISLIVLGTFGYDESLALLSPVVSLMQSTTSTTGILERLDLIFLSFWMMAFYKIKMIHMWFTLYIAQKCWPKLKAPIWIGIYATFSFIGYLLSPNYIYLSLERFNNNSIIYTLLLPALLLIYLIWKKKKVTSA